jgi:hypothetical protein
MQLLRFIPMVALPALLWLATAGCATSGGVGSDALMPVIVARAEKGGFSSEEIPAATHLYNLKCARCHKFYDPAKYSEEEWSAWMGKMSRKAKLKPAEEELLARFLGAGRRGG